MSAGRLNQRITIQALTKLEDTGGGACEDWIDFAEVWAGITPISGRQRYVAQQVEAAVDHEIEIRYRAGVVAGMRAIQGPSANPTREFHFRAVFDPDGHRQQMIILAEEVRAGASDAGS